MIRVVLRVVSFQLGGFGLAALALGLHWGVVFAPGGVVALWLLTSGRERVRYLQGMALFGALLTILYPASDSLEAGLFLHTSGPTLGEQGVKYVILLIAYLALGVRVLTHRPKGPGSGQGHHSDNRHRQRTEPSVRDAAPPKVGQAWIAGGYLLFLGVALATMWTSYSGGARVKVVVGVGVILLALPLLALPSFSTSIDDDGATQMTLRGPRRLRWSEVRDARFIRRGTLLLEGSDGRSVRINAMFFQDFNTTLQWVSAHLEHVEIRGPDARED